MNCVGSVSIHASAADREPRWRLVPMRACEMREALMDELSGHVGKAITPKSFFAHAQRTLDVIVRAQFHMRSVSVPAGVLKNAILDLGPSGEFTIVVSGSWYRDVDRLLMNSDCGTCGSLVTYGVPHTRWDCGEALARAVIES